jgi:hypothetical protein
LGVLYYYRDRRRIGGGLLCNFLLMSGGTLIWATGKIPCDGGQYRSKEQDSFHSDKIVAQNTVPVQND